MFWARIRYLLRRDRESAELNEEMRLHVELRARSLAERGAAQEEARFAARRQFGNPALLLEASADQWGWRTWVGLGQDVRQGFRTLRKSPGFAAFAILTLALGLGMNSAIFSVVNGVMLRPLPYPEAGRLVSLWEESTKPDIRVLNDRGSMLGERTAHRITVSFANLADYRARSTAFEALGMFDGVDYNLTGDGVPERVAGEAVSSNLFPLLEVEPRIGRGFTAEDERLGADGVVILTHELWQRRLGGDPGVLGRDLILDGRRYRIVGVLPAGFRSPMQLVRRRDGAEFFIPAIVPADRLVAHGDHDWNVVGKLRPGISLAAAQAELNRISTQLTRQYPDTNEGIQAVIAPLRDDLVGRMKQPLFVLLAASGLIVLITCVNIANLLLVRAVARTHETSVRFALGASRSRVMRQFLAESMVLAAGGCAAGLVLGEGMLRAFLRLAPDNLPRMEVIRMDWRVFAAGALLATITGLAAGLAPGWHAASRKAADALKAAARNTGGRPQALARTVLTAGEVALSLVLLTGAGLLLKSFITIIGVDLGFRADHVLAFKANLPVLRYPTPEARLRFFQNLEARVQALPGVESTAYANRMPLRGGWGGSVYPDFAPDRFLDAGRQVVSTGYFRTLGIALVRGRLFTAEDMTGHPLVAIVDQTLARNLFGDADPIGRRVRNGSNQPWVTIVGVVTNMRRGGKDKDYTPQIYLPAGQTELYARVSLSDFAVRISGDPRALVNGIQQQVWALDHEEPLTNVHTLEEIIDRSVAERRFETMLLLTFAGLAVGLAMLGVYGVLSYGVAQRTPELGIRLALGARPGGIVLMVLRQAGVLVGAGAAVGLAGSLALSRFVASLLFHVKPTDAWTYGGAVAALALVAAIAAFLPARRGARIDPNVALRYE